MEPKLIILAALIGGILLLTHAAVMRRRMRRLWLLVLALTVAGLSLPPPAQAKGQRRQSMPSVAKPDEAARKKADEEAYQAALKAIPPAHVHPDPWQSLR